MKKRKRISALALSVLMLCQTIVYIPAKAASSAEGSGTVALGSSAIAYTQKLTDNGNGTYTLTLTVKDASYVSDVNSDFSVSRNSYFTAPADGDYLVEIWGGRGADGSSVSSGGAYGVGGAGGHVYGVVELKKGDVLFYQLGGDGQQTIAEGEGGGANGDGAGAGDATNYTVGGGGGYSAVYQFDAGEFDGYLDAEGNMMVDTIYEGDRTTKYILIAGGGGGGGASSAGLFGLNFLTDAGNPPDGGAGGSMESETVSLSSGTVYKGGSGSTSGSDPSFIGEGGSDEPGEVAQMWLTQGWFSGSDAKNWFETDGTGGAGGTGNGRGGSGGAGYCGGSGGVQTEIILPTNVGGGGGGSSFVAASVKAPTEEQKSNLSQDGHDSETGGGIFIKPLSSASTTELSDGVDLTLTASEYFDITEVSGATPNVDGTYHAAVGSEETTISVVFTPKPGFAGGNNVPLTETAVIACASTAVGGVSCSIPLDEDCLAVNVPLNFTVDVNSYTNYDPGYSYELESLYNDTYSGERMGTGMFAFIESVSEYSVNTDGDDTYQPGSLTVSPLVTTYYPVSFTVTPKPGAAAVVGDPVTTTPFTANAVITVHPKGTGDLNGNSVTYKKSLAYDDKNKTYILSLETKISSELTSDSMPAATFDDSTVERYTYPIDVSGYYYIQAWGGDGGAGQDTASGIIGRASHTGGSGGVGAYLGNYVYLKKGDEIEGIVGGKGTSPEGKSALNGAVAGKGGGGGGASTVTLIRNKVSTGLISSAGGGGGGGSYSTSTWIGIGGSDGFDGKDGLDANLDPLAPSFAEVTPAGTGAEGKSTAPVEGDRAPGGTSFLDTTLMGKTDAALLWDEENDTKIEGLSPDNPNSTEGVGAIRITPLQLDALDDQAEMKDYEIKAQLSQYFVLADATDDTPVPDGSIKLYTYVPTGEGDEKKKEILTPKDKPRIENGLIVISGIDPEVIRTDDTTTENGDTVTKTVRNADFDVEIRLKPRKGFLGGNDVPLLTLNKELREDDGDIYSMMVYVQDDDTLPVGIDKATDYANVAIDASVIAAIEAGPAEAGGKDTDRTIDLTLGEDSVPVNILYTWEKPAGLDGPVGDWKDDYVTVTETVTCLADGSDVTDINPISPQPLTTTRYLITAGLAPTKTDPTTIGAKQIDPPAEAAVRTLETEIIVLPRIKYELNYLSTSDTPLTLDGYFSIEPGVDHAATLSVTESGYSLPTSIEVIAADGSDISDLVGYNASNGQFTIPSAYAVGTITVRAEATAKTYTVTYYYYPSPGSSTYKKEIGGTYAAGATLHETLPEVTDEAGDGYHFSWDWGDGETEMPEVMPARNLIVIGTFAPEQHTLTIRYQYEGGEQAEEPYVEVLSYGTDYQVTSPLIDGYTADTVVVSGTMGLSDVNVTVTYTQNTNQLTIYYFFRDGTQALEPYTEKVPIEENYTVASPTIDHYTPDPASVSGTMGNSGATYYVYYDPNNYTVTFDLNYDGAPAGTTRTVQYGKTYAYDAAGDKTLPLPVPSRNGYEFLGWTYTEEDGGEYVKATDPITPENHSLYAQWKKATYTVTIRYILDDAAGTLIDFDGNQENPLVLTGELGSTYEQPSPVYGEYTPSTAVVEGTFTENTTVVVVYTAPKTYTVTIYFLWKKNEEDEVYTPHPTFETIREEGLKSGDSFSYTAPKIPVLDGYDCTLPTVEGTIKDSDLTFWVYYYPTPQTEIIEVTVEWGSMTFNYSYGAWQPEKHIYASDTLEREDAVANRIMVTNGAESTVSITAGFSYANDDAQYPGLQGFFVDENGAAITQLSLAPSGNTGKAYLNLTGTLDRGLNESQITSGTCTVTIAKGGG